MSETRKYRVTKKVRGFGTSGGTTTTTVVEDHVPGQQPEGAELVEDQEDQEDEE